MCIRQKLFKKREKKSYLEKLKLERVSFLNCGISRCGLLFPQRNENTIFVGEFRMPVLNSPLDPGNANGRKIEPNGFPFGLNLLAAEI